MLLLPFCGKAQTTLSAGDIAFTGYNSDGDDSFSFILLAPITSGTVIKFTDQGWSGSALNGTEGEITWTSTSAMSALTIVTILPTGSGYASAGSLTVNTAMSLASGGDQIFALQGTLGTPTFIAGVHMSVEQSTYPTSGSLTGTDSDWDGVAVGGSQSKLSGTGLTPGFSAVWLYDSLLTAPGGGTTWEVDNARAKCSALTGTVSQVRAKLFQRSYWDYDNGTAFAPTSPSCTPTTTTWNGSTWDNGAPTASLDAVIASSTTPGSFTCKDLTINSGFSLTMSGTTATINGNVTNNGNGFAGTGTFTFAASGALSGNTISTEGTVTVSSGATLTTNGLLTLASNASNTGRIGNSAGTISGNVTVQRYIPGGRRAFRFFGHPFSTGQRLDSLIDDIDITGSGGSANGFTTTVTNNPSAFWYDVSTANGSGTNDLGWTAFANATSSSGNDGWNQYKGIRVLVRGAKNEGLSGGSYTPSAVTLDMTGPVNQGSQVVNVTKGAGSIYALVANPFPSQIQMNQVTRGGSIATFYYTWDANGGTRGTYTARLYTSSFILPSFACYVTAIAATSTITFPESCKSTSTPAGLYKSTATKDALVMDVYSNNDSILWDKLQLYFNTGTSNDSEMYDAGKLYNPDLSVYSFSNDNKLLAIDSRPYKNGEVIKLGVAYAPQNSYKFKAEEFDIANGVKLYLHDNYLNKTEEIKPGFEYSFDVTSDTLSQGDKRFQINMIGEPASVNDKNMSTQIQLAPNPATNEVAVTYQKIEGTAIVRLTNLVGQVLQQQVVNAETGKIVFSLGNIPAGIYIVELQSNNARFTEKLIKQ